MDWMGFYPTIAPPAMFHHHHNRQYCHQHPTRHPTPYTQLCLYTHQHPLHTFSTIQITATPNTTPSTIPTHTQHPPHTHITTTHQLPHTQYLTPPLQPPYSSPSYPPLPKLRPTLTLSSCTHTSTSTCHTTTTATNEHHHNPQPPPTTTYQHDRRHLTTCQTLVLSTICVL